MRDQLAAQIPYATFAGCWLADSPPYETFLDAATQRLEAALDGPIVSMDATLRAEADGRLRVDGHVERESGVKVFYLEMVWMESTGSFRGKARVRDPIPEPEPKSVDQFIAAIDAIVSEGDLTIEGQVFRATQGVDEAADDLPRAYPAIFGLFERFPTEQFGCPGTLVHMMEARGDYEFYLERSLTLAPSMSGLVMAMRILKPDPVDSERWRQRIRAIADSEAADPYVRDTARDWLTE